MLKSSKYLSIKSNNFIYYICNMAKDSKLKYTEQLGIDICEHIAQSQDGIRATCKKFGITPPTFYQWLQDERKSEFAKRYARAKDTQIEMMADEILDIADDRENDTITIEKNGQLIEVENKEWVNRSRLRIDTRKWIMSKLAPKKYGDKLALDTGENEIIVTMRPSKNENKDLED